MKELPSEEEEIPFRIKTYKKKELACMYNPNITPRCAIRIFTKWIKINKELLRLLTPQVIIRVHERLLPGRYKSSPVFWTFHKDVQNTGFIIAVVPPLSNKPHNSHTIGNRHPLSSDKPAAKALVLPDNPKEFPGPLHIAYH